MIETIAKRLHWNKEFQLGPNLGLQLTLFH